MPATEWCCPHQSRPPVADDRRDSAGNVPAPPGGASQRPADSAAADASADRAYRVGFKRTKREDYAVDRLREAAANLHDVDRVNRVLAELARFYNAIADAPVVSLERRQQIVQALHAGHVDEARRLIDDCLARYEVEEGDV
jgi:hypothetical protein